MAEIEQNTRLEVDDETAEQLLDDAGDDQERDDQPKDDRRGSDDDRDWKSEAEKWKNLSRKNERDFKTTAERLKQYEDANKSEAQRLQDERDSHKTRAEKAEAALKRRELAEELAPAHATLAQIKAVAKRLNGDDAEAMEADARELFELIAPEPPKSKTPGRPKERLRGGGDPEDDDPADTDDPRKLAALIHGDRKS